MFRNFSRNFCKESRIPLMVSSGFYKISLKDLLNGFHQKNLWNFHMNFCGNFFNATRGKCKTTSSWHSFQKYAKHFTKVFAWNSFTIFPKDFLIIFWYFSMNLFRRFSKNIHHNIPMKFLWNICGRIPERILKGIPCGICVWLCERNFCKFRKIIWLSSRNLSIEKVFFKLLIIIVRTISESS